MMQAIVTGRWIGAKPRYNGVVMIEIGVAYPAADCGCEPGCGPISLYYERRAHAYFNYASHSLYAQAVQNYEYALVRGYPFHMFTAMTAYTVTLNCCGYLSLYTDTYEYTGGAHGNTVRKAETWRLCGARRVTLTRLFPGVNVRRVILREVYQQISEQIAQGNDVYFDDYQRGVVRYLSLRRFYLTPDGVVVYYPLYTIAPYSSGIVTFLIPYDRFGGSPLFLP